MAALEQLVRQGKVLYAGISSYNSHQTGAAAAAISRLSNGRVPLTIHQPPCSMMNRGVMEDDLPRTCARHGLGIIAFSVLNKGLLTDKYLGGVPEDSRAGRRMALRPDAVTDEYREQARKLNEIAQRRGQSLAQMSIAWILRDERFTSVVLGASSPEQIEENVAALNNLEFDDEELAEIDEVMGY